MHLFFKPQLLHPRYALFHVYYLKKISESQTPMTNSLLNNDQKVINQKANENLKLDLEKATGRFKKKLTIGFSTFHLNISSYLHIIAISNTYMIKSIQMAIIQAFTAH